MNFYIKNYEGTWYAFSSGSPQMFKFSGATGEEQYQNVRAFANFMGDGEQTLLQQAKNVFPSMQEGEINEQINLFLDADELWFGGGIAPIFEAAEESSIGEELAAAAEALLEALV